MKDPTMLETKPTSAGQGPDFLRETGSHEPYLAACHKLSERLTATTNYLTAALSLCETEPVAGATLPGYTEMLKKASDQPRERGTEAFAKTIDGRPRAGRTKGVLTITLPKTSEGPKQQKKIEVKSG